MDEAAGKPLSTCEIKSFTPLVGSILPWTNYEIRMDVNKSETGDVTITVRIK